MNNISSFKKILITGSKGFIGSFLMHYLSKHGFETIGFEENLNTATSIPECDLIIHSAGRRLRKDITIEDFVKDNVLATINLTKFAKGQPIIFLSTKAVYVFKPYGITKLLAEYVLTKEYGNAIVLRLPKIRYKRTEPENLSQAISIGVENFGDWIIETINHIPSRN